MRSWRCLLVGLALLFSCAEPPQQVSLLAAQQARADAAAAHRRLFYIGLGLYPETWSANDVTELADELQRTAQFEVVPLIATNFATDPPQYPLATDAAISRLVQTAAERARSDDVVMVHISTHGSHGMLADRIGGNQPRALTGGALANLLAPLGNHPTVIIISACYSGSLIPSLRAPNRIIIAAARADRSSFGCAAGAKHTFFGDAELDGFGERHRSLHDAFTAMRADVSRMERDKHFQPSEPQVWIGTEVAALYNSPLF
jgi:hypothetical protein